MLPTTCGFYRQDGWSGAAAKMLARQRSTQSLQHSRPLGTVNQGLLGSWIGVVTALVYYFHGSRDAQRSSSMNVSKPTSKYLGHYKYRFGPSRGADANGPYQGTLPRQSGDFLGYIIDVAQESITCISLPTTILSKGYICGYVAYLRRGGRGGRRGGGRRPAGRE